MKRTTLFITLILAFALAMPAFAGGEFGKGNKIVSHRIFGVLEGTFKFVPFPNATSPYEVDSLGDTSGFIWSLGRASMFTFQRPDLDGNPGDVRDGLVKILITHRDTLQGEYVGTTVAGDEPDQLIGNVDFVITGGTGRFANASGTIHGTAYVLSLGFDVFEWPVVWVLKGTIEY